MGVPRDITEKHSHYHQEILNPDAATLGAQLAVQSGELMYTEEGR